MGHLTSLAILVVSISMSTSALFVFALTYYISGAPAARHELYAVAAKRILEINGGPPTLKQRLRSGWTTILKDLSPFKLPTFDNPDIMSWARSVLQQAKNTDDHATREMIYGMMAATTSNTGEVRRRFQAREDTLIKTLVDSEAIEASTSLLELKLIVAEQDRARRNIWRHASAHFDRAVVVPLCTRGLDYIGRGTAFGLLVGAGVSSNRPLDSVVYIVGLTTLIGGALGSVFFLSYLNELLPAQRAEDKAKIAKLEEFRTNHPFIAAAVFPLVIAVTTQIMQQVARQLSS